MWIQAMTSQLKNVGWEEAKGSGRTRNVMNFLCVNCICFCEFLVFSLTHSPLSYVYLMTGLFFSLPSPSYFSSFVSVSVSCAHSIWSDLFLYLIFRSYIGTIACINIPLDKEETPSLFLLTFSYNGPAPCSAPLLFTMNRNSGWWDVKGKGEERWKERGQTPDCPSLLTWCLINTNGVGFGWIGPFTPNKAPCLKGSHAFP